MATYLSSEELMALVERCGAKVAVREGDPCFVLHSGMHARVKYEFERLFQYKNLREIFAREFAALLSEHFGESRIDVLAGPESVGPFLAEIQNFSVWGLWSRIACGKKTPTGISFPDYVDVREEDTVLCIDDVLTGGFTLAALQENLFLRMRNRGPRFAGCAVLLDRSEAAAGPFREIPRPYYSLLEDTQNRVYAGQPYFENACPFCFPPRPA